MKKEFYNIEGYDNKEITIDLTYDTIKNNKKLIIFSHGFKGFKDWGCFNLVANYFAEKGFIFLKYNFSHNGVNSKDLLNFIDLHAFGQNNFSKELFDLDEVITWSLSKLSINFDSIILIGHSRGGGISILKSSMDKRIDKLISWASPSNFLNKFKLDKIPLWKERGVVYIYNGRTKQNMPLFIQFYNDCIENKDKFNIKKAIFNLQVPFLIVHGNSDPTVSIDDALEMKSWKNESELFILEGADHVFGSSHPYFDDFLPKDLKSVLDKTINFINQ
ncbi:MAG: alpha/beta hydrolase [Flavobacteriales bacterium]|nr:alpha/beta hydrolase [Flavobacteriales bacterium]